MCHLYLGHLLLSEQVCVLNTAFFLLFSTLKVQGYSPLDANSFGILHNRNTHYYLMHFMCVVYLLMRKIIMKGSGIINGHERLAH